MRSLRRYLPGAIFHLTARTQGKIACFTNATWPYVIEHLQAATERSGCRLIAYVLMPNHLHLVVQQSDEPLSALMQPLLRRIALLVQKRHGSEGHVFERRYRDRPCLDAEHARNAIVYTHLNPVRAGICGDATEHWPSSAAAYSGFSSSLDHNGWLDVPAGLSLFAPDSSNCLEGMLTNYLTYVAWRQACDALESTKDTAARNQPLLARAPLAPSTIGGDATFASSFCSAPAIFRPRSRPTLDLASIARACIADAQISVDVSRLRSGERSAGVARLRRAVAHRARLVGWRTHQIAQYLGVSDSCVSRILSGQLPKTS